MIRVRLRAVRISLLPIYNPPGKSAAPWRDVAGANRRPRRQLFLALPNLTDEKRRENHRGKDERDHDPPRDRKVK